MMQSLESQVTESQVAEGQVAEVVQAFSRAATQYDAHSRVQLAVGRSLLLALPSALPSAPMVTRILELGCGTGQLTEALHCRFPRASLLAVDAAPGMLAQAQQRLAGYHNIQLASADITQPLTHLGQFDLIVSNFTLHWCGAPQQWLPRLLGLLVPGGRLLLSLPIAKSLQGLQQAWSTVDDRKHINLFPQHEQLLAAAAEQSAQLAWQEVRIWRECFVKLRDLLHSIKGVGANRVMGRKPHPGLMGRQAFVRLENACRALSQDPQQRLVADYRVWSGVVVR